MTGTRDATVRDVLVGEGQFDLRLDIDELIHLQEITSYGPMALLQRFRDGNWFVNELTQTIRLALVGGGMKPADAFNVVKRNVTSAYLLDYVPIAMTVMHAALIGVTDDPVGESEAATTEPENPTHAD